MNNIPLITKLIKIQYFKTDFGELILGSFDEHLCLCDWRHRKMRNAIDKRIQNELEAPYLEGASQIIELTKQQLTEYFKEERQQFDIPLLMIGTTFQKQVWQELLKIPYGETVSYLELSKRLNNTAAIRAVGSANGANAISIIVPCHRVVGQNGNLTGYAGGLPSKKKLLLLENQLVTDQLALF